MSTSNNNVANRGTQKNYLNFNTKKRNFVQELPFWQRYRRGLIISGSILTFCIVYSAPIYYFLRTPPEHYDPRITMWPSEVHSGKTHVEQLRERRARNLKLKAEAEEVHARVDAVKAKMKAEKAETKA